MSAPDSRASRSGFDVTPADAGLSGLGLVMSLGGTIFLAMMCGLATLTVIALMSTKGLLTQGSGMILVAAICSIGASIVRSAMHRAAGQRLLYFGPDTPRVAIRKYLIAATVQTAIVVASMMVIHAPLELVAGFGIMLAAWPVALAIAISAPRFAAHLDAQVVPVGDDRGYTGTGVMMMVFGIAGTVFAGVLALDLLRNVATFFELAPVFAVAFLAIALLLVVRSVLHVRAGAIALRSRNPSETAQAVMSYGNVGVAVAITVALLLTISSLSVGGAPAIAIIEISIGMATLAWALCAWPAIVKRLVSERESAMWSDAPPPYRPAADGGSSTLGWLLFSQGVFGIGLSAMVFVMSSTLPHRGEMFGELGIQVLVWAALTAVLQLGAGVQLFAMQPHRKLVATIYGVAGAVIAVISDLPTLKLLAHGGLSIGASPESFLSSMMFVSVVLGLVLPIMTIVLVNRRRTA